MMRDIVLAGLALLVGVAVGTGVAKYRAKQTDLFEGGYVAEFLFTTDEASRMLHVVVQECNQTLGCVLLRSSGNEALFRFDNRDLFQSFASRCLSWGKCEVRDG